MSSYSQPTNTRITFAASAYVLTMFLFLCALPVHAQSPAPGGGSDHDASREAAAPFNFGSLFKSTNETSAPAGSRFRIYAETLPSEPGLRFADARGMDRASLNQMNAGWVGTVYATETLPADPQRGVYGRSENSQLQILTSIGPRLLLLEQVLHSYRLLTCNQHAIVNATGQSIEELIVSPVPGEQMPCKEIVIADNGQGDAMITGAQYHPESKTLAFTMPFLPRRSSVSPGAQILENGAVCFIRFNPEAIGSFDDHPKLSTWDDLLDTVHSGTRNERFLGCVNKLSNQGEVTGTNFGYSLQRVPTGVGGQAWFLLGVPGYSAESYGYGPTPGAVALVKVDPQVEIASIQYGQDLTNQVQLGNGARFGESLAVSPDGESAAVGIPYADVNGTDSGAVVKLAIDIENAELSTKWDMLSAPSGDNSYYGKELVLVQTESDDFFEQGGVIAPAKMDLLFAGYQTDKNSYLLLSAFGRVVDGEEQDVIAALGSIRTEYPADDTLGTGPAPVALEMSVCKDCDRQSRVVLSGRNGTDEGINRPSVTYTTSFVLPNPLEALVKQNGSPLIEVHSERAQEFGDILVTNPCKSTGFPDPMFLANIETRDFVAPEGKANILIHPDVVTGQSTEPNGAYTLALLIGIGTADPESSLRLPNRPSPGEQSCSLPFPQNRSILVVSEHPLTGEPLRVGDEVSLLDVLPELESIPQYYASVPLTIAGVVGMERNTPSGESEMAYFVTGVESRTIHRKPGVQQ